MNPILEQFLVEARENLLYLDKNLESLSNGDKDTVNALFRAAHTLKGSSGLAQLDSVKETTHIAEDLLDAYRNDKIEYSSELLEVLYDMFDEVTELVDATEESGELAPLDEEKMEEFKKMRASILQEEEVEVVGIDTELNIIDDEVPAFADFFKNDFDEIDITNIPFDVKKLTLETFQDMNYYIIDLDLNGDTLEIGNDPFYSLYLLENENIISLYTEVLSDTEQVKENPLNWTTRIVALVYSNQELLEDAFYNFMEDVAVYPLSIKSLFNTNIEKQSNDSLYDFIEDLKRIASSGDFSTLEDDLEKALEILNKESQQGFIIQRVLYMLQNHSVSEVILKLLLEYILGLIVENNDEEQVVEVEKNIVNSIELNLEQKEVTVIRDILLQQKTILTTIENDNVVEQVKSILHNLEANLGKDFDLVNSNDKNSLLRIIEHILASMNKQYDLDDVVLKEQTLDTSADEKKETKKETKKVEKTTNKKPESEKKAHKHIAKTVKVELEDIDAMMDTVGELLVIKNSLPYIADALNVENVELSKRDLHTRYDEINRLTTALQEKVMQMRLMSLSFIFDRYPKLVRDISKSLEKKIKYSGNGGDTKLDKTIIEKLADPLIHILRNSLDHGIETPEEREASGKNPEGQISIDAQSIGDKVYIVIKDDGKGIDVDKIVNKSLEKKMVDPEALDTMSREEKLMLVFHPGVSSMDEISELSGRGVGMDVVRQTIDDIGGKISLESELGVGTTLTLELPMSVALTNVFHIKLGITNYALSMDTISETVQVPHDEIEYVNKKPMLKLRGSLIPLVFFYNLLSEDIDKKENYSLVIIDTQGSKFGVIVDEFVNQLDIIQKPLSSNFKSHPYISGTSLLGNGEVLFVVNPIKLINLKEK